MNNFVRTENFIQSLCVYPFLIGKGNQKSTLKWFYFIFLINSQGKGHLIGDRRTVTVKWYTSEINNNIKGQGMLYNRSQKRLATGHHQYTL